MRIGSQAVTCLILGACSGAVPRGPGAPVATRDAALALILGPVVDPKVVGDLEIFAAPTPMVAGTTVAVLDPAVPGNRRLLVTASADSWLVFADLEAGSRFEHPVKIALVQASDGRTTVFDGTWWPIVNGIPRWISATDRASGDRVFAQHRARAGAPATRAGASGSTPTATQAMPGGDVPAYCHGPHFKYALVISASDDAAVNPSTTDDLALLLHSNGYTTQQLKPSTMPSGWDTFQAEMHQMRTQMEADRGHGYCDEFLLVWSGHGVAPTPARPVHQLLIQNAKGEERFVSGQDLVNEVEATTNHFEGFQVRVLLDACFAAQSLPTFQTVMPPDPNEKGLSDIIRDVLIIAASGASEAAAGDAIGSATSDAIKCIKSKGAVDFSSLPGCIGGKATFKTPESRHWWNNGT